MNQSIQDRLVRDYPFLKSVESFGCGDGWYNLLDQLCQSIQSQLIVSGNAFFRVTHVREKFGRLRVDFVFGDPEITRITETASKISAKTCEVCGAIGATLCYRDVGWIYFKTYCETHASVYGYKVYVESPTTYWDEK